MTSMHSYRHQPAAACIGGAVVAGGEALAARPVFRRLSAASQVPQALGSGSWDLHSCPGALHLGRGILPSAVRLGNLGLGGRTQQLASRGRACVLQAQLCLPVPSGQQGLSVMSRGDRMSTCALSRPCCCQTICQDPA